MDVVRRKQIAKRALTDLEEVVLDVLHEAGVPLRGGEISKRIDIPVSKFVSARYPLIHGVLESLACKGLVCQPMYDIAEYSWGLTEKATERMKDKKRDLYDKGNDAP